MSHFTERVYKVVKTIPPGKIMTYGQIARLLGKPKAARAVGNALHRNREPHHIPCYRVVNSIGKLSFSYAYGGASVQRQKLLSEGITFKKFEIVDLPKHLLKM